MSDHQKWVVLKLSKSGQKKDQDELIDLFQEEVNHRVEFFIPSASFYKRDQKRTVTLMDGYVFVEGGLRSGFYYQFESTPYVQEVLTRSPDGDPSNRVLCYMDQSKIEDMKRRLRKETLKDVGEGDRVQIVRGTYQNMEGRVLKLEDRKKVDHDQLEMDHFDDLESNGEDHMSKIVYVQILGLQSMNSIVQLPLQFVDRGPDSGSTSDI